MDFYSSLAGFTLTARSLPVAASSNGSDGRQKGVDYKFQSSQDGVLDSTEDLNAMDYTAAKRKPPIHN